MILIFYKIDFWWWNNKTYNDWIENGKEPVKLAALHWKHNVEEIKRQSKLLPKDRYYEMRYEDFTEQPEKFFKEAIDFCELDWNDHFKSVLRAAEFENRYY